MGHLYFYVDETYRKAAGYWHCNIGGALLPANEVLEAEIALEACLFDLHRTDGLAKFSEEFKYTAFFTSASDDLKLKTCTRLVETLLAYDVSFIVSHAKIAAPRLQALTAFGPPAQAIQHLAHINVSHALAAPAAENLIQIVVDLGLSESFRSVYDVYASSARGLKLIKAQGIQNVHMTVPHYMQLLPPVFADSKDSRLIQFSDLLIGLLLVEQTGLLTPFKTALLECLAPLLQRVQQLSVEWNKSDA
jgi:hypothetical protein